VRVFSFKGDALTKRRKPMTPTTKRTTQRVLLRISLLLALLTSLAGIGQSQTAATCQGASLSLRRETGDAAMGGKRTVYYSFKNNSQSPCKLQGWPSYVLLDRAGRQIKPPMPPGEGVAEDPKPVTLAPGGKAFFAVNYTSCESIRMNTGSRKRCTSSAKARITAHGTRRTFTIREVIDPERNGRFGADFDVSPISSTLEELGISIEKRKS
jgi:Protein of unknown function (DUF4232)